MKCEHANVTYRRIPLFKIIFVNKSCVFLYNAIFSSLFLFPVMYSTWRIRQNKRRHSLVFVINEREGQREFQLRKERI